jgi:hypothetical protein
MDALYRGLRCRGTHLHNARPMHDVRPTTPPARWKRLSKSPTILLDGRNHDKDHTVSKLASGTTSARNVRVRLYLHTTKGNRLQAMLEVTFCPVDYSIY